MSLLYLAVLLVCLGGSILIDLRFHLVFGRSARTAGFVLACGIVFFLAWDLCGITLGIFARGENAVMTGILLAPELPVEEGFFLAFLCHLTLVLIAGSRRITQRRRKERP
nr:lycopene cyclase domain-containing protein [Microbacterium bovistercoris]